MNREKRRFRIGVDTGGTFTDVVLVDETSGEILVAKVATVPADPSVGCMNGIEKALAAYDLDPGDIASRSTGRPSPRTPSLKAKARKLD